MGKLEYWNLNKEDNAAFICAFNYSFQKYNGTTDSGYYYDKYGNVVWEGLGTSGLWEPKDPLNIYTFFCKGRYNANLNYNLFMQVGDSISTGAFPYMLDSKYPPITNFVDTTLGVGYKKYKLNLQYSKNNWGYEEWQQKFGITYDNLYKAEVSRDFGISGVFGLSYLNVVQDKYKTEQIEIPSFDEIMLKWTYNFERILLLKKNKNSKNKAIDNSYKKDNTPPEIAVSMPNNKILTLNDDGLNDKINFNISVKDESNLSSWSIAIANEETNDVIFKKDGMGDVPLFFEWTIVDANQISNLKEGKYSIKVTATDAFDNSAESQPEFFDIYTNKSILNKNIMYKLVQDATLNIREDQNFITFQYKLKDIYNLSENAVDKKIIELIDVLTNEKIYKIKIISTTDLGRNSLENKNISQKISGDISKVFTSYGINLNLIETIGLSLEKRTEEIKEGTVEILCYYK